MAFPCNQFGNQEPGTNAEIKAFAEKMRFRGRLFAKANVNGPDAVAPWKFLEASAVGAGEDIQWNFAKFLVGRDGVPVKKYGAPFDAKTIERDVDALLRRYESEDAEADEFHHRRHR